MVDLIGFITDDRRHGKVEQDVWSRALRHVAAGPPEQGGRRGNRPRQADPERVVDGISASWILLAGPGSGGRRRPRLLMDLGKGTTPQYRCQR